MARKSLDYDPIATTYDARYRFRDLTGVGRALLRLARRLLQHNLPVPRVLEAGCGTGHWLAKLAADPLLAALDPAPRFYGLDLSAGMLGQARTSSNSALRTPNSEPFFLLGRAGDLPFSSASFRLVYCINALHHFHRPQRFIEEARGVLAPGGALFIANMDPHTGADLWTVYDYFSGTRQTDLERYPPMAEVRAWMRAAGFRRIHLRPVEQIERRYTGADVFQDPILGRTGTSQLALLTDDEYSAGIDRMQAAIATVSDQPPQFHTDITLWGITGYVG